MRRNKDVRNGKARYYFYCASAYNYSQTLCNTSSIADYKIFDMVLKQIRLQIELAVEAETFIKQMTDTDKVSYEHKDMKGKLVHINEKLQKYIYLKTSIYEDMKQGILTKEEFRIAKEQYGLLAEELGEEKRRLEKELEHFEQCMNRKNKWMEAFLKFRDMDHLTREIAIELLEKVELYENRRIHIRFRFRNEYEYLVSQTGMRAGGGEYDGAICG